MQSSPFEDSRIFAVAGRPGGGSGSAVHPLLLMVPFAKQWLPRHKLVIVDPRLSCATLSVTVSDQCLATLVSDWPSACTTFPGLVGSQPSSFLQRLLVPGRLRCFCLSSVSGVSSRRGGSGSPPSLFHWFHLQWQTTLHTLRRDMSRSLVVSFFFALNHDLGCTDT